MLSDVLSDALDDIRYYQKTYPEIYGPYLVEIKKLKRLMNRLRVELDTPPQLPTSETTVYREET